VTLPPVVPPLDDAAPVDVPLADFDDDELDELPQAASAIAAMTVSSAAAAGLVFLITDPPPQRSSSQSRTI
jgi:hypothetical protein